MQSTCLVASYLYAMALKLNLSGAWFFTQTRSLNPHTRQIVSNSTTVECFKRKMAHINMIRDKK